MPKKKPKKDTSSSLRLEWRSPAELMDNPSNWRRHPATQIAALTDVIGEVGWAGACLFNEQTGRLIDGHARRKVALEQGTDEIPVLIGSWDEATERKIIATLDPLAAMAEADGTALAALLADVQTGSQAIQALLDELRVAHSVMRLPTQPANDPAAEWQGMPEFNHEDGTAHRTITVHFADEEAVRDFAARINQEFSVKAKYIYHPKRAVERTGERYGDEPEVSGLHHLQEPLAEPFDEQGS